MKKFVLFTIIGILIATSAYSQDKQELAKSDSLFAMGVELYNAGKYAEAIPLFVESDRIDKAELDITSNRRDYSAMWLASCYYKSGDKNKAEDFYVYYMLEPIDRRLTVVSDSLSAIGMQYARNEDYEKVIEYFLRCAEIEKNTLGNDNYWYGNSLSNIAQCYYLVGNYAEAVRLGTEALEIRERVLGKGHPDYAILLSNIAQYNFCLGNYAEAVRLGTEALEICEKIYGKEFPTLLGNVAGYNFKLGNYAEAIRLGTEALEIMERVVGKENPDYVISLNNLAEFNSKLGNYAEAIRLGTEALEIMGRVLGKENSSYATSLGNIASYNSKLGNYAESIRLGTEAMEIMGRVLGKENSEYATLLSYIAHDNSALGNYAEAVRLETEALEIMERVFGKESPEYAKSLNNLAACISILGYNAEAIRLATEALEIEERTLGKEHPDYAASLSNLSVLNSDTGDYAEAIRLGTEALEIRERVLGKEHPLYALSLGNLANYNSAIGNYDEAVRLGTEALEITERILGKEYPDYAFLLSCIAVYNAHLGNYSEVSNNVMESTHLQSQLILNTFSDLTSMGRALFWDKYKDWFEGSLPQYSYYIHNDSLTIASYDSALLSKGLLLNTELEMNKLLQESGDSVAVAKYEDLRANRAILNKLYEKPIAERNLDTDSLEKVIQSQERELVQLSKTYGDYTKNLSIDWRDVQEKLGKDDVAIEFLSFPVKNDSIMYVALTLTKDDDVPHMTSLFEKKELDDVDNTSYYKTADVSQLVWKPLSDVMEGKENVYFAPAGELHNIAVESIPFYGGDELVSDKWNMYRLSSTRSLALIKDKNDLKRADVYGGLDYTTDSLTLVKNSMKYGKRSLDFTPSSNTIALADSLNLRAGVNNLPGTKVEASNVDRALEAMKLDTQLYTDTIGTEASFKALSGQRPNVLHIATHGFYWTESEAKDMSYLGAMAMFNDDTRPRYVEDKALTRSGLFFAGANRALKGGVLPEDVDDGILTAKEISTLDLRGLDLVVLSACQTGLGEITGDGVFGLQRGFKKAGANTIMMSLWKVDDDATQMLMSKFYHNLLLGENKKDALMKAQEYLRTVEDGKYSDPQYWAAFILLDAID